jgi:membrane peptidoglycan carboxypeptidase
MLAGAVNAPTYDDPLVYPVQARARLVHVIARMAAVGYLTKAQQAAALKAPLDLSAVRGCRLRLLFHAKVRVMQEPAEVAAPYFAHRPEVSGSSRSATGAVSTSRNTHRR